MHIGSLSGHRQTPLHCSNTFCFSKNLEERDTLYPNPKYCNYLSASIFPLVVSFLFHALQRNKDHSIPDFKSKEEHFPLWGHQPQLLNIGAARQQNLSGPIKHPQPQHSFCWLRWELGSSHMGSAVKGKVNSSFRVA